MIRSSSAGYGVAFRLALNSGLINQGDIDAQGVKVHDVSARNEVYRLRRGASVWYVKTGPAARREKDVRDALRKSGLRHFQPKIIAFDASVPAILVDSAAGTPIQEYPRGDNAWPRRLMEIAEALAEIGRTSAEDGSLSKKTTMEPIMRLSTVSDWSAGQLSILARLQNHTEAFEAASSELSALPPRFAHGDPRPTNVFWEPGSVQLIDWELAGLHPPLHDISLVLAHLTQLMLFPALAGRAPSIQAAASRSAAFREAATTFISAYAETAGPFCPSAFGRALAFAYVTQALEIATQETTPSAASDLLTELGLQLVREPMRWTSFLLPLKEVDLDVVEPAGRKSAGRR